MATTGSRRRVARLAERHRPDRAGPRRQGHDRNPRSGGAALDARVSCRLTWNGEELDRLLDAAHAAVVEQVVRRLAAEGWVAATEVSFNEYGERGSIDVLGFHPATRCLLVVEVKSVIPDVQAT